MTVGETGRASSLAWLMAPRVMDRVIGWALPKAQSTGEPPPSTDNLYGAGEDGEVYLEGKRKGLRVSPYTQARLHPGLALGAGAGLVAAATWFAMRSRRGWG